MEDRVPCLDDVRLLLPSKAGKPSSSSEDSGGDSVFNDQDAGFGFGFGFGRESKGMAAREPKGVSGGAAAEDEAFGNGDREESAPDAAHGFRGHLAFGLQIRKDEVGTRNTQLILSVPCPTM